MVILSFSYTSPNISNLIISYKPAVLFLIKNIKKHKKADKSDRKQQQNSMSTAHSSIKKSNNIDVDPMLTLFANLSS